VCNKHAADTVMSACVHARTGNWLLACSGGGGGEGVFLFDDILKTWIFWEHARIFSTACMEAVFKMKIKKESFRVNCFKSFQTRALPRASVLCNVQISI
jgi:hypothetical protein